MCGGSPLILNVIHSFTVGVLFRVGENTQGRRIIINSRSPLSEPE